MTITKEGALASFYTVNKAPIKHLRVYFSPKQAGTGDPSPSNVREISGWNSISCLHTTKSIVQFTKTTYTWNNSSTVYNGYAGWCLPTIIPDRTKTYIYSIYIDNTNGTVPAQARIWHRNITNSAYVDGTVTSGNDIPVGGKGWSTVVFNVINKSNTYYMAPGFNVQGTVIVSNPMVELGNQMTEYEPYKGIIQTIDWSNDIGTVYGGYVDLITGELVQEQIGRTFIGSDATRTNFLENTKQLQFRFYTPLKGKGIQKAGISMSDKLKYTYTDADKLHYYVTENSANGNVYAYVPLDFSDNDTITFVASLYTPIVHQLNPQQLRTFIGRNNIWSNADRVEVEYDLAESNDELYRRRNIILQSAPHLETVTGDIVNFNTDVIAPIKDAKIYFNPIQEGSDDPSPEILEKLQDGLD